GGYLITHLAAQLEPMAEIAPLLVDRDTPVADRTGLTGKYSFILDFTRDRPGATPDAPPPAPSVFTAVEKELGLRLAAAKLPVDVVVVESFNKTPGEN
ncbi:MAG TPA: TIGR03435 family protein, partial [Bryobacteraceae bacterium]|nr:TIGR03435 family protein [Bryobacteraceae bacterium]